jgi:N-methylhydantoinase A
MRYQGQYHNVEIEVIDDPITGETIAQVVAAFHDRYQALYGYSMPWQPAEVLALHVRGSAPRDVPFHLEASSTETGADLEMAVRRERRCLTPAGELCHVVYDRDLLRPGHRFAGPALVDGPTTTVLVPATYAAEVDEHLSIILTRRGARPTAPLAAAGHRARHGAR